MKSIAIELCGRRPSDLPSLRRIGEALETRGFQVQWSGVEKPRSGANEPVPPAPIVARVVVETSTPSLPEGSSAEARSSASAPLVVLWDSCVPAGTSVGSAVAAGTALGRAQLVLAPDATCQQALRTATSARVEVTGLPRFDSFAAEPRAARSRARRDLGLADQAQVVVYAPSSSGGQSAVESVGERLCDLCGPERIVLVAAEAWPEEWLESHRRWAAARAGLLVLECEDTTPALLAADVVVGDAYGPLRDARHLGLRTVCVTAADPPVSESGGEFSAFCPGGGDLAHAVRAALEAPTPRAPGSPPAFGSPPLDGGAASRAAAYIEDWIGAEEARTPASGERSDELFARLEAQTAFGDADAAADELRAHLSTRPSAEGLTLLASIERRRGNLEAAATAAGQAVERGRRGAAGGLCERARIDVERGEFARAREQFEQASRLAPELAEPLVGLGSLDLHAGDAEAAERRFRRGLELDKSARAWSGLGLALAAQTRYRDALVPLEAALDVDPDCQAALYGLVQAGFQTGELGLAANRLTRYVETHPGSLDFVFTLAGICCELGERERALDWIDRIEVFDPQYPGLRDLREKLEGPLP